MKAEERTISNILTEQMDDRLNESAGIGSGPFLEDLGCQRDLLLPRLISGEIAV